MKMHNKKERTKGILEEVNTHLYNIGLLETVDNYLNSQAAYTVVDTEFANWTKTLRDFAAKMPIIAHKVTGDTIDNIVSTKEACRKAVFVGFKQNLSAAMEILAEYVSVESTVKEIITNAALEEMWSKKLTAIIQALTEAADEKAKTDIVIAAIKVTDTEEDQMALAEALAEDPNAIKIMMNVDRQAYAHEAASVLADTLLGGLFGGLFDDDDDTEE